MFHFFMVISTQINGMNALEHSPAAQAFSHQFLVKRSLWKWQTFITAIKARTENRQPFPSYPKWTGSPVSKDWLAAMDKIAVLAASE